MLAGQALYYLSLSTSPKEAILVQRFLYGLGTPFLFRDFRETYLNRKNGVEG
jgi:hypothetical protein